MSLGLLTSRGRLPSGSTAEALQQKIERERKQQEAAFFQAQLAAQAAAQAAPPSAPPPVAAPAPGQPTATSAPLGTSTAQQKAIEEGEAEAARKRRSKELGRAATVLTGPRGLAADEEVKLGRRMLLGA